tara:strand:- start:7955 stop:8182 length:228 start_codon:yes stop_codon:yes gene_type:complete
MLACSKKIFNKFLFVSVFFLIFSVVSSVLFASAKQSSVKNVSDVDSQQVQVEQRQIIYHLEKIEKQLVSKQRVRK